jgi:hypothetical protein
VLTSGGMCFEVLPSSRLPVVSHGLTRADKVDKSEYLTHVTIAHVSCRARMKAAAELAFGVQWQYRWNNEEGAQVWWVGVWVGGCVCGWVGVWVGVCVCVCVCG